MAFAYFHKTNGAFQFVSQEQHDTPWNNCFDVGPASNGDWFDLVDGVPVLNVQKSVADDGAFAIFLQEQEQTLYQRLRAAEYPPITDYIDGVVKSDQAQIDAYIAACQAVKAKYPKP